MVSANFLQLNCGNLDSTCRPNGYLDLIFKANCIVQSNVRLTVSMANHPKHLWNYLDSGFLLLGLAFLAQKLMMSAEFI